MGNGRLFGGVASRRVRVLLVLLWSQLASTRGAVGIVALLSSLYPVTTILLARAVLHERIGATRTAGG